MNQVLPTFTSTKVRDKFLELASPEMVYLYLQENNSNHYGVFPNLEYDLTAGPRTKEECNPLYEKLIKRNETGHPAILKAKPIQLV